MARKDAMKTALKNVRAHNAEAERVAIRDNAAFDNDVPTLTPEQAAELDAELAGLAAEVTAPAPETPTVTPAAPAKGNARRDAELAERARLHDERSAEYAAVIALHQQGLSRADIAKQLGTTYSRLTFVLWHHQYGIDAIPGMATYTKAKKDAAQTRYEADVKARKAAK